MTALDYLQEGRWIVATTIMSFSFFAGWATGFALKTLFRVALFFSGIVLLAVFTLQYADIIPVINWERAATLFQKAVATLKQEGGSLFDFVLTQLPTASAAAAGFYFGIRRIN